MKNSKRFHLFWYLYSLTTSFSQPQQFIPKLDFTDEQILRLIEATGDQQIISREYINGEHHILTRNENGEHIITRIVTVCVFIVEHSIDSSSLTLDAK